MRRAFPSLLPFLPPRAPLRRPTHRCCGFPRFTAIGGDFLASGTLTTDDPERRVALQITDVSGTFDGTNITSPRTDRCQAPIAPTAQLLPASPRFLDQSLASRSRLLASGGPERRSTGPEASFFFDYPGCANSGGRSWHVLRFAGPIAGACARPACCLRDRCHRPAAPAPSARLTLVAQLADDITEFAARHLRESVEVNEMKCEPVVQRRRSAHPLASPPRPVSVPRAPPTVSPAGRAPSRAI